MTEEEIKMELKKGRYVWECQICHKTIESLYPEQIRHNAISHTATHGNNKKEVV